MMIGGKGNMDQIDQIIAYEQGELDNDQTLGLFQALVDSGLAWKLQGCYGRTARQLIDSGMILEKGETA